MRLFVGVWPPEPAMAALAALPRPALPHVRWTAPGQWHVTLAFLGTVAEDGLGAVQGAVEAAARDTLPAEALLGPATTRLGRAVLCVPVEGLAGLAGCVRSALADAGMATAEDDRAFQGHCTLARARGRRPIPPALAGMPISAAWPVTAVCLVRSVLDPAGARYETLLSATVPS